MYVILSSVVCFTHVHKYAIETFVFKPLLSKYTKSVPYDLWITKTLDLLDMRNYVFVL